MKFQYPSMHSSKVRLCINKISSIFFKGHNSGNGIILTRKKKYVQLFLYEKSIHEISKP